MTILCGAIAADLGPATQALGDADQSADHNELRCWFASWPWDANVGRP